MSQGFAVGVENVVVDLFYYQHFELMTIVLPLISFVLLY